MPVVDALHVVPVKGMAALAADRVEVGLRGIAGDRVFSVLDGAGGLHTSRRRGALPAVRPALSAGGEELALAFPSGEVARGPVVLGARRDGTWRGKRFAGRRVEGPFGAALARHLGRPAELVRHDDDLDGWDDAPVTLMTAPSLTELARQLGREAVDRRRFRMGIEVAGAALSPRAEDGWVGGEVAVGGAVLEVVARCGRCVVATRHPDTGAVDLPTLKGLAGLRGPDDACLGVLCRVVVPGVVAVGDDVRPSAASRGASGAA